MEKQAWKGEQSIEHKVHFFPSLIYVYAQTSEYDVY